MPKNFLRKIRFKTPFLTAKQQIGQIAWICFTFAHVLASHDVVASHHVVARTSYAQRLRRRSRAHARFLAMKGPIFGMESIWSRPFSASEGKFPSPKAGRGLTRQLRCSCGPRARAVGVVGLLQRRFMGPEAP